MLRQDLINVEEKILAKLSVRETEKYGWEVASKEITVRGGQTITLRCRSN